MDYGTYPPPDVTAAFNRNCAAACTVTTCSCTQSSLYWSATTLAGLAYIAWVVDFDDGLVYTEFKPYDGYYVRAVRSGL